jgi:hypothetical protein
MPPPVRVIVTGKVGVGVFAERAFSYQSALPDAELRHTVNVPSANGFQLAESRKFPESAMEMLLFKLSRTTHCPSEPPVKFVRAAAFG